jgi:hypothetical protein
VSRKLVIALSACGLGCSAQAGLLDPIATCTLTLSASGKLVMSGDGMTLGSQIGNGTAASMAVVGVNLTPKLTFSSLTIMGPTGWAGSPTAYLSVDSLSGQKIPYTTAPFSITPGILIDTLSINAKVVDPNGFKAGTYNGATTITCESA